MLYNVREDTSDGKGSELFIIPFPFFIIPSPPSSADVDEQ